MTRFPAALLLVAALPTIASARPIVVGRVGMVARGQLAADAIGLGARDGRAAVTVRAQGGSDALRRAGFDAQPLAGDVAQLLISADELRRLLATPTVINVEERRILRPALDQSAPAVGAPAARLATGLDGTGVLVGIVDTGIDFRHRDLRKADGTTRVAALLDVSTPRGDLHPELPAYAGGALWLRADIDAVLGAEAAGMTPANPIAQRDTNGHGTHVAGIAGSDGLATNDGLPAGRYVGIAPGADLVIAQATHGGNTFSDSDIIVSCRFAVDQGTRLGEPVVVNLSLGGPGGPHDGTSDLEAALDQLFADAPGRALVIAAGNGGDHDQHAGAWALDGSIDVPVSSPSSQPTGQLAFEIWYTGSLSISLVAPSGSIYGPATAGNAFEGGNGQDGHIIIDNGASTAPRSDGKQGAAINIEGANGSGPASGTWTLKLKGTASRWDVWITDEPGAGGSARFTTRVAEDDRLSLPATAKNGIIVGSFDTRGSWTTVDGQAITRTISIGDPSPFSPTGPTADGRFAPDVIAPGEYILSAMSSDAPPSSSASVFFVGAADPTYAVADDGLHGTLRGTSQAAPHVAGAIALLMQANPLLTGSQLREILRATAHDDARGFSPRSGFGKLDVLAAARYVTGTRGSAVDSVTSSVGVSRDLVPPGDERTVVTVTPRDADGVPLGPGHQVSIDASAGVPAGDVVDAGEGRYERAFVAHAPRGTVASISASVDGVALSVHPSVYFVNSRAEIGQAFAAGGGCSLPPAGAAFPGGLLVLAALFVAAYAVNSRQ